MTRKLTRILTTVMKTVLKTVMVASLLSFSVISHANTLKESPSALAMATDALIVRPVLLATTVVGSAVYLVSLPFSLLGGNSAEAGEVLVAGPAKATFTRCLGCTRSGRKHDTVEQPTN
jgi:hypothetical protein